MNLKLLENKYCVCRAEKDDALPLWAISEDIFIIAKIEGELSVVCRKECVPEGITCEPDFRIIQIADSLDFSAIGIIADISAVLKKAQISIFLVSTYSTNYIMVKEEKIHRAVKYLRYAGYEFV
ncbi:MAG: ACT domain-containing protein [Clostridia bacterium]|nr:ACT domain-containing protein [Clostridia bacterium]